MTTYAEDSVLTIAMEVKEVAGCPFYRARVLKHHGAWATKVDLAVSSAVETVPPEEWMRALGVSAVITDEMHGICACGVPLLTVNGTCERCS